jgi:hypothetical protein
VVNWVDFSLGDCLALKRFQLELLPVTFTHTGDCRVGCGAAACQPPAAFVWLLLLCGRWFCVALRRKSVDFTLFARSLECVAGAQGDRFAVPRCGRVLGNGITRSGRFIFRAQLFAKNLIHIFGRSAQCAYYARDQRKDGNYRDYDPQ